MLTSAAVSSWRRSGLDFGLDAVSDGRVGLVVLFNGRMAFSSLVGK